MMGSSARMLSGWASRLAAALGHQCDQRAQHGGACGREQRQEQRVPGHAAAHAADHAGQAPDAVLPQPVGQRACSENGPDFVEEGADQALAHRQRHEQQQQRRAQHHRAGHEDVAAEEAQARDAGAHQHQQAPAAPARRPRRCRTGPEGRSPNSGPGSSKLQPVRADGKARWPAARPGRQAATAHPAASPASCRPEGSSQPSRRQPPGPAGRPTARACGARHGLQQAGWRCRRRPTCPAATSAASGSAGSTRAAAHRPAAPAAATGPRCGARGAVRRSADGPCRR